MNKKIKEAFKKKVIEFTGSFLYGTSTPLKVGKNGFQDGTEIPKYHPEGFLCELYMEEHGINWERYEWEHQGETMHGYSCLNHTHGIPKKVLKWAGIGNVWLDKIFYGIHSKEEMCKAIDAL